MFANCPVRPLLAEVCRGVVSTTLSGIFAFTFSALPWLRVRYRNAVCNSQQTNFPRSLPMRLQGGTVGSIALSRSRRRRSSNDSSSKCRRSIASLPNTRRHICAYVPHTGAGNSRSGVRMSSTDEELSKYSADDPRRRAVSKLGVVGPELDGNSSGNPSTLVQHQERIFHNV